MTDFRNLDQALEAIKARAVQTSQGSFIKVEDMEELLTQFRTSLAENKVPTDGPKSFAEAHRRAQQDPELASLFAPQPVEQQAFRGQSIPVASEGVKS